MATRPPIPTAPEPKSTDNPQAHVVIHRHPDCTRCARFARIHHALDWGNRLETTTTPPPRGPVPLGKIAIVDRSSGRQLDGPAAMAALFRQVPAYWPLLLLLSVPGLRSMLTADLVSPAPV